MPSYICHELRNPLHGISGLIEGGIAEVSPGSDAARNMALALETAGHMSSILNDMLDLSKARAGVIGCTFGPVARLTSGSVGWLYC